jgi:glycerol-3-phosphate acyltransferase PlsY
MHASPAITYIIVIVGSYLLGSIPFGLVVARYAGLGDIRKIGSGNIGATNVLRTGNKGAAFLTLIGDGGKGTLAVLIGREMGGETGAALAAAAAFLGHLYPVWLRFNGGKGVATFLGLSLGLCFPAGLAACLTWLAVAFLTRYSSLSALTASALAPVYLALSGERLAAQTVAVLTILVFIRHSANIRRLIAGTEPKIGGAKTVGDTKTGPSA